MGNIAEKIVDWIQKGSVGESSKCMAMHLSGRPCSGDYPHDAGDFDRCVKMLEAVPELRPIIGNMAKVNSYWAALVKRWSEIEGITDWQDKTKVIAAIIRPIEDRDPCIIRVGKNATLRFGNIK